MSAEGAMGILGSVLLDGHFVHPSLAALMAPASFILAECSFLCFSLHLPNPLQALPPAPRRVTCRLRLIGAPPATQVL